jgi:hypothetical protein
MRDSNVRIQYEYKVKKIRCEELSVPADHSYKQTGVGESAVK